MNGTKSAIVFAIAILIMVGVFWGVMHGFSEVEAVGAKLAWILGSLAVGALTVFLSYQKFLKK